MLFYVCKNTNKYLQIKFNVFYMKTPKTKIKELDFAKKYISKMN